jgi:sarcosine oxidase subunit beta
VLPICGKNRPVESSSSSSAADVLVVGAGVIGSAAALALARAGHSVLVVDRARGVGHGSTAASAGIVRVHATDPQSATLAADATGIWEDWGSFVEAVPGEPLARFQRCGSVILDSGNGYVTTIAAALAEADLAYERWDLQTLAERLPAADLHRFGPPCGVEDPTFWAEPSDYLTGALYTAQSGFVADPALAATNLMDAAVRHGARLALGEQVGRLHVAHDRVHGVALADGRHVAAGAVLLAAGPHTDALLRTANATEDFNVGTRRIREELHHIPVPADLDVAHDGVHLVDGDLGINLRPESGNAFLVGGDGAAVDGETLVADPDAFDPAVTAPAWERNTLRLARRFPSIGVPGRRRGVVGLYDVTDDWLPIYDRTAISGLFVAMGTSGNQFKTAPVVGELLRQIIELELDGIDHTSVPLKSPLSGNTFQSAQFSRLRLPASGGSRG